MAIGSLVPNPFIQEQPLLAADTQDRLSHCHGACLDLYARAGPHIASYAFPSPFKEQISALPQHLNFSRHPQRPLSTPRSARESLILMRQGGKQWRTRIFCRISRECCTLRRALHSSLGSDISTASAASLPDNRQSQTRAKVRPRPPPPSPPTHPPHPKVALNP